MLILLQLILAIVHIVYSICVFIGAQWALVQRRWLSRIASLIFGDEFGKLCDTNRIEKLPGHLVIVVGYEDVSFADLAKIIGWTVQLGIPHVTFYDMDGVIKRNSALLRNKFETLRPNLVSRISWEQGKSASKNHTSNGINGFLAVTKIHFLSYENGKHEIVELTKELSHAVTQGYVKVEDINISLMDEKLRFNFPEPDLAIVCGKLFSTFGVLPWHIRITEFFQLTTHHNVSEQDFMNILVRYGSCEQRYGK